MDARELVAASQAHHGCGPSLGTYAMYRTLAYQLDVANDTATLTIATALAPPEVSVLLGRCRELAAHIATLHIDLRSLGAMRASDVDVVRAALNAWRLARGGSFQLTTSHLVATCRQIAAAPTPVWSSTNTERRRETNGGMVRDYCVAESFRI